MARHEVTLRRVLYEIPGMASVAVRRRDFPGADGQPLPMAIYSPISPPADPPPVVVLIEGYPDPGLAQFLGCRFMEMEWTISMAQLIAASGLAVVTYANREPEADANAVLAYVRSQAGSIGVDGTRIGLWATSGHGPVAVSVMGLARCAVLTNPYTFDHGGAAHVAEAAQMFKFAAPAMPGIPPERPLFVVRSGNDEMPGLNASLDRFVALALAANGPITLVNHPEAPHSFDLFHDSATTRHILRQALAFLADQLHTWATD